MMKKRKLIDKIINAIMTLVMGYGIAMAILASIFYIAISWKYIVDLEKNEIELLEEEKNKIVSLLMLESSVADFIEISHMEYAAPFNGESSFHIFYKRAGNEYVYEHICSSTYTCEKFCEIRAIIDKYYKWWRSVGKKMKHNEVLHDSWLLERKYIGEDTIYLIK